MFGGKAACLSGTEPSSVQPNLGSEKEKKEKAECEPALRRNQESIDSGRCLGSLRLDWFLVSFRGEFPRHSFVHVFGFSVFTR
jgi:hypothetical protein